MGCITLSDRAAPYQAKLPPLVPLSELETTRISKYIWNDYHRVNESEHFPLSEESNEHEQFCHNVFSLINKLRCSPEHFIPLLEQRLQTTKAKPDIEAVRECIDLV